MRRIIVKVPRHPNPLALALVVSLLVLLAVTRVTDIQGEERPKPVSKVLYVLPQYLVPTGNYSADVASLRQRLGEGRYVRVGFSHFVPISMDNWGLNVADRAAVRAGLGGTVRNIDDLISRARANGIPINFSLITAIRERRDPVQLEAERSDRRNVMWYNSSDVAEGWVTHSRYARKFRRILEAYVRELGTVVANRMARYPATLVASSGDGETELSYERSPVVNPAYTETTMELTDYSPFAIAEFRDWLRNGGLYAPGQPYAGQGFEDAARYQGDASPAADTNGDGRTLNGDFGTTFNSWNLRYFDWSLTDSIEGDPNAIPSFVYEGAGFNKLPPSDAGRFDAPRVFQPGNRWWNVWHLFRQVMVANYNRDFARWMTTTVDPETRVTIPTSRWFSHQLPADYLFGFSPDNPQLRWYTSASSHWTADVTPYGGLGITSFNVNIGNGDYAVTTPNVAPLIAQRNVPWAILEWNPSLPVSNSLDVYEADMAVIERYRPTLVAPFGWGDPFYQFINTPFETALRGLIARIKDGPVPAAAQQPAYAPMFLPPGRDIGPRPLGPNWPKRLPVRERLP